VQQLFFALLATVSVAALSVLLITQAVRRAERVVVAETTQALTTANHELEQQYRYRVSSDSAWNTLPAAAKDVSLRGLTLTVLRSYPGVEGGFYQGSQFLGYAFPTHYRGEEKTDVPSPEKAEILETLRESLKSGTSKETLLRETPDLVVIRALPDRASGIAVWTMKRLAGQSAPSAGRRDLLLAGLVFAALLAVVGTLATAVSFSRGVAEITRGLEHLEKDFAYRLPQRRDEFGQIIQSINKMASVRRNLEERLRREERLTAIGRLAAGIGHELRNPLNSIRLTMQLLEIRLRDGTARQKDVELVMREVDRMNGLLTDLLDLQRTRKPQLQKQPVIPVLQHCIAVLEAKAGALKCTIRVQPAADYEAVFDEQQLTQVLMNLILNALDASPAGGTVDVELRRDTDFLELSVTNPGPQLTGEQQEHLFEAFYSTKPNGTGLGLAVSRELMRAQHGDVYYRPGVSGATFVIRIPTEQQVETNYSRS
jgi:signal transduction histidine kinase